MRIFIFGLMFCCVVQIVLCSEDDSDKKFIDEIERGFRTVFLAENNFKDIEEFSSVEKEKIKAKWREEAMIILNLKKRSEMYSNDRGYFNLN